MGLDNLITQLGLDARHRGLVQHALTHKSYINESGGSHIDSNERLEFLGDAALGLVVAAHLYRTFPQMGEGEMTNLRSLLVRGETLSKWAIQLDLGERLLLGKGLSRGDEGRRRPRLLASTFEALVGVIFLEKGLPDVAAFLNPFMTQEIDAIMAGGLHRDYKNLLQEIADRVSRLMPEYKVIGVSGPDHQRHYAVTVEIGGRELGRGEASSKQEAERIAARTAYIAIEKGDVSLTPWADEAAL